MCHHHRTRTPRAAAVPVAVAADAPPHLRVSDAERRRVAEELRVHAAEGRLDVTELEERLERADAAKTHGDLDELLRDLPRRPAPRPAARRQRPRPVPELALFALVNALLVVLWALGDSEGFWPAWSIGFWGLALLAKARGPARPRSTSTS